ncbi:HdeD family acid-resistance protein [Butyrivibrio sp. NC2002]|uniref:HdeD family acid-resistance protein n=1 Tax=Butyrivibrio sp. NC2002 TaxID=1410610 RepID=UPI00056271EB|nr:DUF308 domain-containing protein [Butyrivibrio sp. NC2002]
MNFFFRLKTNFFIDAIILVVVGLILVFLPGTTLTILTKAIGVLILVAGIASVASGIIKKEQNMLTRNSSLGMGLIVSVVGLWILINPHFFESIIPIIAGVIILFSGLMNLGEAISLSRSKYSNWWVALILAVLTILVGAFLLFRPVIALSYVVQLIGGALIYNGISNLWIVSRIHKVDKENGKEVIDVESKEL